MLASSEWVWPGVALADAATEVIRSTMTEARMPPGIRARPSSNRRERYGIINIAISA